MKIVQIRSRMLFGGFYPRGAEGVPEGLKFAAGVALTQYAPALLFCYVVGHYMPLYLVACVGAVSTLIGLWMSSKPSGLPVSCFPAVNVSGTPGVAHARRTQDAA